MSHILEFFGKRNFLKPMNYVCVTCSTIITYLENITAAKVLIFNVQKYICVFNLYFHDYFSETAATNLPDLNKQHAQADTFLDTGIKVMLVKKFK